MFRKIASYSASLYLVTMGASAVSFAVTMVIARRIPKDALGAYGFYVTVYALLGLLLSSGLNQAIVKFLGDSAKNRVVVTRVVLAVFAGLGAICWPTALLAAGEGSGAVWTWGIAAVPFSVLILLANSVFRAEFASRNEITSRVTVSLLNSLFTLGFAFLLDQPRMAPIWGDFLSMALPGLAIVAVFLRRGQVRGPRALIELPRSPMVRRLFAFAIPLTIAGVAFVAYNNSASLLLRAIAGLGALGEYYFALQLMNVLEKPMTILANVVLAGFARKPDISVAEHRQLVGFNLMFFPILAAAIAVGAPLLMRGADTLLTQMQGDPLSAKFAMAPVYVSLFALAVPARCVEFLVSSLAIARGRPEVNRNTHVATTAVSLPLMAFLVWRMGPWGAALMPLAYQGVFLSLQTFQLRREMPEIIAHTSYAAIVSTLLLGGVLGTGRLPAPGLVFPFAAAAYLVAGHALGAWDLTVLRPFRVMARGRVPPEKRVTDPG